MSRFGMVAPSSGQVGAEGEGGLVAILQLEVAHPLGRIQTAEDAADDRLALFGVEMLAVTSVDDLGEGVGRCLGRWLLLRGAGFEEGDERNGGQRGECLAELAPARVGARIGSRSIHR